MRRVSLRPDTPRAIVVDEAVPDAARKKKKLDVRAETETGAVPSSQWSCAFLLHSL